MEAVRVVHPGSLVNVTEATPEHSVIQVFIVNTQVKRQVFHCLISILSNKRTFFFCVTERRMDYPVNFTIIVQCCKLR